MTLNWPEIQEIVWSYFTEKGGDTTVIKRPTVAERQKAWEAFQAEEAALLLNKGADYTAGKKDADAYANFRIISDLLKGAPITPFTVAMVYFLKHILSVITYTISGKQESGEGLDGRFHDIRNYAFILRELIGDHEEFFTTTPTTEDHLYVAMIDEFAKRIVADESDDFVGYPLYWDEVTTRWRPVAELNSTKPPVPQPGEMESLIVNDDTMLVDTINSTHQM